MEKKHLKKGMTMKRNYLLTDNRFHIYGNGPSEHSTRKEAVEVAVMCAELRLASGIPTRKPYVLTIHEYDGKYKKALRTWEIRVEIKNVTKKGIEYSEEQEK